MWPPGSATLPRVARHWLPAVMGELPRWGDVLVTRDIALRGVEKPVEATSIGVMGHEKGHVPDPICGLPLSSATAEETASGPGGDVVLFCSTGCLDTWLSRPSMSDDAVESVSPTD